jgi:preprotein translocase subunit Sss1
MTREELIPIDKKIEQVFGVIGFIGLIIQITDRKTNAN